MSKIILPKSANLVFKKIKEILDMGWIIIPGLHQGSGAPGNFLETLLSIDENNYDSPDLRDWELKFHGGTALITLFHKTPEPRGIMYDIVERFGWQDGNGHISFRHTIQGASEKGFFVVNENDKLYVKNSLDNSVTPFWAHNALFSVLGAKLRRLILVEGKYQKEQRMVIYENATAFWDIDIIGFCQAVTSGVIRVDFDVRTTGGRGTSLRDHGTKFRVHINDIGKIYQNQVKIT